MAKDASKTVVSTKGGLYVAAPGTAVPAIGVDPDPGDWTDLGWLEVAGPTFAQDKTIDDRRAWPGNEIIRSLTTETTTGVQGTLLQMLDKEAFILGMAGGSITNGEYTPSTDDYLRAMILDVEDGANKIRIYAPSMKNVASVEANFPSDDLGGLALDLRFQKFGTEKLFRVLSTDPTWA